MRYLPLHPGSAEAIVMLEAARVQGKLEPVMAAVLEAQPDWHAGKRDAARAAAEKAGLDVATASALPSAQAMACDRKSGGEGKSVSGRVQLGGGRLVKKK